MMSVFNNLVLFRQNEKQNRLDVIEPELAVSWSWSEDYTRLSFRLRHGVKWHDGKPFTAQDVKCTWDMLTGKSSEKLRLNPRKAWYRNLDEVTTDGDYAATFVLKRPQPAFLMLLATGMSPVYPCHVSPRDMRSHPIGTGPFKFVDTSRTTISASPATPIIGRKAGPISTASSGRSFRTVRRRRSPSSPASST
jgi:peptide/nickel transport system substrate-binding protein